jgi:hypothetical protein
MQTFGGKEKVKIIDRCKLCKLNIGYGIDRLNMLLN